jgi:hypothetical protein
MKIIFMVLFCLFLLSKDVFAQTYTNGVYVKNGITIEVDKKLHTVSNEVVYFSNELIVKSEGELTINSFSQEVFESPTPKKSKLGAHNLSATVLNGNVVASYNGGDENSSCVISTALADLELVKGTFLIKASETRLLVVVLDGSLKAHNGKKQFTLQKGDALVAVPNDLGILEDKISLSVEKVKPETLQKLVTDSLPVVNQRGSVLFAYINGKTVGILIN